jgi:nitrate/nitrite-specific signal transduction histidine kinase
MRECLGYGDCRGREKRDLAMTILGLTGNRVSTSATLNKSLSVRFVPPRRGPAHFGGESERGGTNAMQRTLPGRMSVMLFVVLLGGTAVPAYAATDMTVAAAINQAGRQRMLSQRQAVAWLMLGLGVSPDRGQVILKESLTRFDTQLAELKMYAPTSDVRKTLSGLEREWTDYRALLNTTPSVASADRLYERNNAVQAAAHRLTLAYEKLSGAPDDRLVNVAGRQRMLSQRLAMVYLFQAWGVNAAAARMEMNFARAEFASGMHQLSTTTHRSPDIKAAVEQLDREWLAYRDALAVARDAAGQRRAAAGIVTLSEQVLATTERLVALYEAQAATGGH